MHIRLNYLIFLALLTPFAEIVCRADSLIIDMPLYDQTDPTLGADWLPDGPSHSELSAPTATAMVLAALIHRSSASDGWSHSSFAREPWQERVINTARTLGTDPRSGTPAHSAIENLRNRRNEIWLHGHQGETHPIGSVATAYGNERLTPQKLLDIVDEHKVGIITYGYYQRNTQFGWGHASVTFKRNGGHVVALRGRKGKDLLINDPWKGVLYQLPVKEYSVENLKTGIYQYYSVTAALPNARNSHLYLSRNLPTGNYAFIEGYSTLSYQ